MFAHTKNTNKSLSLSTAQPHHDRLVEFSVSSHQQPAVQSSFPDGHCPFSIVAPSVSDNCLFLEEQSSRPRIKSLRKGQLVVVRL